MAHLSLYRKYRSQSFSELIGQDHVVRTLQNALSSGKISHAYLFTGPRGTGKTSTARLLAKCLCEPSGPTPTPDPDSEISRSIATGSCVDVVEMDAASESGVDDIRQAIVEAVEYRPMMCPYKVFIIDEVHDLSTKAFDALLKTIEEPPPHVVFILATTEYNKVPTTIRSRCQKFEFHRASIKDLVQVLSEVAQKEGADIEPAALTAIARMADGGYRDALTLLEQLLLTADGTVKLEDVQNQLGLVAEETIDKILVAINDHDAKTLYEELDAVAASGRDPRAVLESLLHRLSDLTRAAYGAELAGVFDGPREAALRSLASQIGPAKLLYFRTRVAEAFKTIRDVSLPRLWIEAELHALSMGPSAAGAGTGPGIGTGAAGSVAPLPSQRSKAPSAGTSGSVTGSGAAPAPKVAENSTEAEFGQRRAFEPKGTEAHPVEQGTRGSGAATTVPSLPAGTSPEVVAAHEVWSKMIAALPPSAHPLKLAGSSVFAVEGDHLTVVMSRQMDVDWYNENPKRVGYILAQLKEVVDRPWTVKFLVAERLTQPEVNETVELPLEGQPLHDRVVAIFQP